MTAKIGIVGAGQVGSTLALYLAQKSFSPLCLVDVKEGLAEGKAKDLAQAALYQGFEAEIIGSTHSEVLTGCQVVVVTAGLPRQPGMERVELLKKNLAITKEVISNIVKYCPKAVVIMVANPVDILTYVALKISGFPASQVMGQGGTLDGARFAYYISQELKVSMREIDPLVIGGHDKSMLPLPKHTRVKGTYLQELLPPEKIKKLIEKTCQGGAEIVRLLGSGSAYYAPAAATARLVEAVLNNTKETLSVSCYLQGQFGLEDICLGVPARLSRKGIEEIIEIELNSQELTDLKETAERYKKLIQTEIYPRV